jgi:hypothetical protein
MLGSLREGHFFVTSTCQIFSAGLKSGTIGEVTNVKF